MPQGPKGSVVKTRPLPKSKYDQHFFSGGFFKPGSGAKESDLIKSAFLSLDIDCKENAFVQMALGYDPTTDEDEIKVIKQDLYDRPEDECRTLFNTEQVIEDTIAKTVAAGLPPVPNVIIYTGHGYQFLYTMPDDMGWNKKGEQWGNPRLKELLKRAVDAGDLDFIDKDAKDIGTRIIPLPGYRHRSTGKNITVEGTPHDTPADLKPFFSALAARYPDGVKVKVKPKTVKSKKGKSTGNPQGPPKWVTWNDTYPDLKVGKRDTCPLCGGSGYRRMDEGEYRCWSCNTNFKIPPTLFSPVNGVRKIALKKGRAIWPADRPEALVLKTATASGKTWLLERQASEHRKKGGWMPHKKVLAIAPFKSLAEQLANRLGIEWAYAGSDVSLRTESVACCMAAIQSKADIYSRQTLQHVHVVVDESEAVLGQFGTMLVGEKGCKNYNQFLRILAFCGSYTLCDQNAGAATAQAMKDAATVRASHNLPPRNEEWWVSTHYRHSFVEVQSIYRTTAQGEQVVETSSSVIHKGLLVEQISAGCKIVVFMYGKAACEGLAQMLRDHFPNRDIRCVTGSKSNASTNDLSQAALTCDVLIYNNAMSTGVSIDVLDHYDHRHVLCGNEPNLGGDMVEQAAHRVRNPKNLPIFISSADRAMAQRWKFDAVKLQRKAEEALEAEEETARGITKNIKFSLRDDYHASFDAVRLGWLQAVLMAAQFRRGTGWAMEYLKTRHAWTTLNHNAPTQNLAELHREAVAAVKDRDALAVAVSVPLSEDALDRVQQAGAEDDAEADAASAARMVKYYGDAYSNAPVDEMKELVKKHKSGLLKKVDVYAQARVFYEDPDLHLRSINQLKRANKNRTVMTFAHRLSKAVVLFGLLNELEQFRVAGALEIEVPAAGAATVISTLRPFAKKAGLKLRDDWQAAPIRQLQEWLKLGNLKLVCRRRGPRGSQTRHYYLTDAAVTAQNRLSQTRFDAFTAEET